VQEVAHSALGGDVLVCHLEETERCLGLPVEVVHANTEATQVDYIAHAHRAAVVEASPAHERSEVFLASGLERSLERCRLG
jgi:hypothetical protein